MTWQTLWCCWRYQWWGKIPCGVCGKLQCEPPGSGVRPCLLQWRIICLWITSSNLLVVPDRERMSNHGSPTNLVARTAHQMLGPFRPSESDWVEVVPPGLSIRRVRGHKQAAWTSNLDPPLTYHDCLRAPPSGHTYGCIGHPVKPNERGEKSLSSFHGWVSSICGCKLQLDSRCTAASHRGNLERQ